ncbi:hypothetical protein BDV18DRAFT_141581 [Aspergillus unguis]
MRLSTKAIGLVAVTAWLDFVSCLPTSGRETDDDDVINRDVAVIGGGSSGTYAAVRLQELGHSVVLVEKQDQLGGHTRTYYDPSGTPIDYGVWVFSNNSVADHYFEYLDIPLTGQTFDRDPALSVRFDLRTGEPVEPPEGDTNAALARYVGVLSLYPYLAYGWDLPDPVPEDLLLPFGEFIENYDLAAAVETLTLYVQGYADILNYPTVYIMKYFNMNVVLGGQFGFSRPASLANSDIYRAAERILGDDVLLNSHVAQLHRSENDSEPHRILVNTPDGQKRIRAEKLIIAMPPLPWNLRNFDLDHREYSLFNRFQSSGYYTSIVNITGLPPQQILNRGADTPYNITPIPGSYIFFPSPVQDLYVTYLGGGDGWLAQRKVQGLMADNALSLRNAGYPVSEPEFVAYDDHFPFGLHVSADEIRDGFYSDLYALQGHRGTFYTGAAFHEHDSAALWRFTERVLDEWVLA